MIRAADDRDVDAIVALEQAAFGGGAWSAALIDGELLQGDVVVAVSADQVVGWAAVRVDELADLTRIAVDPRVRRLRLGRALLAEAIDLADLGGAERMLLEVAAANSPAIALYSSAGFVEIARRLDYYGRGADAVVMELAPLTTRDTLDA